MNHIKIIKTDQEHEQALLIERYEEQNFPMDIPDPIDAIKFRMDQMNLKNKDLVPYQGDE